MILIKNIGNRLDLFYGLNNSIGGDSQTKLRSNPRKLYKGQGYKNNYVFA